MNARGYRRRAARLEAALAAMAAGCRDDPAEQARELARAALRDPRLHAALRRLSEAARGGARDSPAAAAALAGVRALLAAGPPAPARESARRENQR